MVAKEIISSFCSFALLAFIAKSVDAAECEVGPGQVYQSGEDFILGCSSSCTCGGPFYSCVPLCPLEQCPPGTETVYENREVAGTDCFCKKDVSINNEYEYEYEKDFKPYSYSKSFPQRSMLAMTPNFPGD